MKIRHATLEDSAGIARVQVESYRRAYAGILPQAYLDHFTCEEQAQDWRDLLAEPGEDILLVAEGPDGEVAGYTLGRPGECDIAPYDSELVALHVRKEFQGQGVGEALLRAMAAELHRKGCCSMLLWVLAQNPARAFYQRLEGQWVGEKQTHLGEGDVVAQEVAYGWPKIETLLAVEEK